ncbi:MAG: SDR family oxidoreductase [Treponema sp.]|jgi:short-subunit dehydrogenase|nr:SDR family oxidoreductase [Treponema sp.]
MARVLITGGSGGIGFELARSFSKRGCHIIINGSNADRLSAAKARLEKEFGHAVEAFVQDLSQPGGAKNLYEQIVRAGLEVDILVNNAGIGLVDATEEIDYEADEVLMRLNMIALVQLCKLFLPGMYQKGGGKILNVASAAAFQPGPYSSTYFASKAFVLSYTRAIRYEAKGRGVQVCALCPNTTKTGFFDREGMKAPPMCADPETVAEFACRNLTRNKAVMIPGFMNNLARIAPASLKMRLAAMMRRLRKS